MILQFIFSDCLVHEQSLCHECKDVGLCDGQMADNCDFMALAEFEKTLNDRLTKLDDQFATINEILKTKKEAFIKFSRKNPRISHDRTISQLQTTLKSFKPMHPMNIPKLEAATVENAPMTKSKRMIICDSFSNDNKNVTVSSSKRSVMRDVGDFAGYCFLNHPMIRENDILKWSVKVPKFEYGWIGMVIILDLNNI